MTHAAVLHKKEFDRKLQQVESLVLEVEALDESAKRSAGAAIRALLELHGETIDRMLELVSERGEAGASLLDAFAEDEMVSGLLLLHGLHPVSLEDRIRGALAKVRPYLGSHGGDVELLGVSDGVARIRLEGSCKSCPSSTLTLKYAIEKEIASAAPDLVDLQVENVTPPAATPAGFVPLTSIKRVQAPAPAGADPWQPVSGLDALGAGELRIVEVEGTELLFCRFEEDLYAYRDGCAACGRSLRDGRLHGTQLECAGCGVVFDVQKAGRTVDEPGRGLMPIPLLLDSGQVKVAAAAAVG